MRTMNRVTEYLGADQVVDLLKRRDHYLMSQHTGAGTAWFVMPGSRRVRPSDIRKIIHRDDVAAQADSLFPEAMPQTWRAR
jgi:hypothetical protein